MTKHQLRIGNKVKVFGKIYTIKELGEFEAAVEETHGVFVYSDVQGVELTPSILLACGLENTYPTSWHSSWESYELQYSTDDKEFGILPPDGCTSGHTVYFPCGQLHLLQNIYFFFTGTELTINLEQVKA